MASSNAPLAAATSALVVAIGAAFILMGGEHQLASAGAPARTSGAVAQWMFNQLSKAPARGAWPASRVLEKLREIYAKIPSGLEDDSEETRALRLDVESLISASDEPDESKCTASQLQWLSVQALRFKQSTLGAYVDSVRQKQRDFCLASFEARLESALASAGSGAPEASRQLVEQFARHLPETRRVKSELYKLDDVPLESLVDALRDFIRTKLGAAAAGESDDSRARELEAASELKSACGELESAYGAFQRLLRIFDPARPAGLAENARHERILWLTKVCNSLKFSSFDIKLHESYHETAIDGGQAFKQLQQFMGLLRVKDALELVVHNKLSFEAVHEALDLLVSERHFKSQSGANKNEHLGRLVSELDDSCDDVRRKLGDFLWLVDLRLVGATPIDSRESMELLKPARVCDLLPVVLLQV